MTAIAIPLIPKILMRLFRRRNPAVLQRITPPLPFEDGATVIIHDPRHEWHGMAGFVVEQSNPELPFMLVTVQRNGGVGFFRPRQLSTCLDFAFSYERASNPT